MAKSKTTHPEGGVEKFLVLPIIVLILAQMGTSGDNGALGLANQQLVDVLGATTPDIQLANMVYSLMAGAFMVAGGLVGTIIGWRTNFRLGAALCAAGELVMALSPNMTIFIWGGRILVGFGASFMIPSVLGLIPFIYHGKNRVLAFGCIGAASACRPSCRCSWASSCSSAVSASPSAPWPCTSPWCCFCPSSCRPSRSPLRS